ncbi:MAG: lysylphosphatidylglycerol synthase transmembrane domain-containing protein [Clostridia bacterium]|nr:lysylphosphatidylglycerol synthase transmembrane domain-containing protein [Clostridia bacterium]
MVENKNYKTIKIVILMTIMLLLIVLTFKLLFRNQDIVQICNILRSVNVWYIGGAVAAITLYVFLGGYAIKIPIDFMGYNMPYRSCFKYSLIEIYFSAITPSNTGGQPMIAVAMKSDKYRFADIAMVLMAVTAIYKIGLMLLALLFLFCSFSYIFQIIGHIRFLLYLGIFINAVFVGILLLLMFSNQTFWIVENILFKFLVKLSVIKNIEGFRAKILDQKIKYGQCADFFKANPMIICKMFLVLILQRISLLVITYFVYKSFRLSGTGLFQILAIQVVLSLSVEMMPLPGAVGISESVFIFLYDAVFGEFLVYPALLLTRGINFYLPFVVSTIYILYRFIKKIILNKGNNNVRIL